MRNDEHKLELAQLNEQLIATQHHSSERQLLLRANTKMFDSRELQTILKLNFNNDTMMYVM